MQGSFMNPCEQQGGDLRYFHVLTGTSMLIEDVACPVNKLAEMTVDLVEMFQKFGYKDASCFGHALEGNLHLVFSQVCNVLTLFNAHSGPMSSSSITKRLQETLCNVL